MKKTAALLLVAPILLAAAFGAPWPGDPWKAPPEADKLVDPHTDRAKAAKRGERIFNSFCWPCHGMAGHGDGPSAATLQTKPAALSSPAVQGQGNGALVWKISTGRGEMPSYGSALTNEERWAVAHYLRTLATP
ncbi:MAG TPA: cytochrome c [Flavobacteriales bacterium]|nr:cytochrome c [Flavobacteriales bacterium]